MMAFLKNLLFRHSKGITDYFSDALRVYVLQGEEDARRAAIVAARVAGKRQRKFMAGRLSKMMSNIMKYHPDKTTRKLMADRLSSLEQEIASRNGDAKGARKEKQNLPNLNEEYLDCLHRADPSIFRRRYPKFF
jgi:hypothetical protein